MNAAPRYAGLFGSDLATPESFWISLRYFNLYRIAVAALFLGASAIYSDTLNLGSHRLDVFRTVCGAYVALGVAFHWLLYGWRDRFNLQLSLHAFADIWAFTLLMFASGGGARRLRILLLDLLIRAPLGPPRRVPRSSP